MKRYKNVAGPVVPGWIVEMSIGPQVCGMWEKYLERKPFLAFRRRGNLISKKLSGLVEKVG